MRLALALGKTLSEIEHMPMSEFIRWTAWDRIQHIGEYRQDVNFGILVSVLRNIASSFGGKNGKPATPENSIPHLKDYHRKAINIEVNTGLEAMDEWIKEGLDSGEIILNKK